MSTSPHPTATRRCATVGVTVSAAVGAKVGAKVGAQVGAQVSAFVGAKVAVSGMCKICDPSYVKIRQNIENSYVKKRFS